MELWMILSLVAIGAVLKGIGAWLIFVSTRRNAFRLLSELSIRRRRPFVRRHGRF